MPPIRGKFKQHQRKADRLNKIRPPGCSLNYDNLDDIKPFEYIKLEHQGLNISSPNQDFNTNARELQVKHILPLSTNLHNVMIYEKYKKIDHNAIIKSNVPGLSGEIIHKNYKVPDFAVSRLKSRKERKIDHKGRAIKDKLRGTKKVDGIKKNKKPKKSTLEKLPIKTLTDYLREHLNTGANTLGNNAKNKQSSFRFLKRFG